MKQLQQRIDIDHNPLESELDIPTCPLVFVKDGYETITTNKLGEVLSNIGHNPYELINQFISEFKLACSVFDKDIYETDYNKGAGRGSEKYGTQLL